MSVADLLDPEKVKAIEDRFSPPTLEELEATERLMTEMGDTTARRPYVRSTRPKRSIIFKRSNFGKKK